MRKETYIGAGPREILSTLIPHDLLMQALTEAELYASNDITFALTVKCVREPCLITKIELHIKYDFINEIVKKVVLEVYIKPDITVNELFNNVGRIINEFKGDFELSKNGVRVIFNIPNNQLQRVVDIVNRFKELLNLDIDLVVEGYEVLVEH